MYGNENIRFNSFPVPVKFEISRIVSSRIKELVVSFLASINVFSARQKKTWRIIKLEVDLVRIHPEFGKFTHHFSEVPQYIQRFFQIFPMEKISTPLNFKANKNLIKKVRNNSSIEIFCLPLNSHIWTTIVFSHLIMSTHRSEQIRNFSATFNTFVKNISD